MITWQDPVALGLALSLMTLAWWWRRWLIKRGAAPHCAQCTAGASESTPKAPVAPTVIDVSRLRLGRRR